jgi:hypothetical protein
MQIRQGDVLMESINEIPKGFKFRDNDPIVARGEATGHYHEIVFDETEKSTEVYVNNEGQIVYNLPCDAKIKHQEHGTIDLPRGTYFYYPQREYSPEEIRNVRD